MSLKNVLAGSLMFAAVGFPNFAQARTFNCENVSKLQSKIEKHVKDETASAAATVLRVLGRNPNPCIKTVVEIKNAAEVRYLIQGDIISDTFRFSENNRLISASRKFTDGRQETIQF